MLGREDKKDGEGKGRIMNAGELVETVKGARILCMQPY
jgi:hypothetical protein